jgi:hypothetical protein
MRDDDDIMSPIVQPSSMPQTTKVTFSEDVKNDNKKIKSYNRKIKLANYDGTGELLSWYSVPGGLMVSLQVSIAPALATQLPSITLSLHYPSHLWQHMRQNETCNHAIRLCRHN